MGALCGKELFEDDNTPPPRLPVITRGMTRPDISATHKLRQGVTVKEIYKFGKTIGTGGFSVVKLVTDRETGELWACKIMNLPPPSAGNKRQPSTNEGELAISREDIFKEIDIVIALRHPNIIYLKEYFEEGNKVYIVMEFLKGGELLDAVITKGTYSETDARKIFIQLIDAVTYMHGKNVVHRDLKLENLLLAEPGDINTVKVADFGLAKKYAGAALSTICGTPQYVAPEVIKGGQNPYTYGNECDLWSCGVILFILLGGYPPFYDDSEPRLFNKIRRGKFDFNDPAWSNVSDNAKDLLRKLLVVDPSKRLTCEQVRDHPWMKSEVGGMGRGELLTKMRSSRIMSNAAVLPQELLDEVEVKEERD
jgi:calcium/calmodulin-dependent protein kinase I